MNGMERLAHALERRRLGLSLNTIDLKLLEAFDQYTTEELAATTKRFLEGTGTIRNPCGILHGEG